MNLYIIISPRGGGFEEKSDSSRRSVIGRRCPYVLDFPTVGWLGPHHAPQNALYI